MLCYLQHTVSKLDASFLSMKTGLAQVAAALL
jgi:hypothetical protein